MYHKQTRKLARQVRVEALEQRNLLAFGLRSFLASSLIDSNKSSAQSVPAIVATPLTEVLKPVSVVAFAASNQATVSSREPTTSMAPGSLSPPAVASLPVVATARTSGEQPNVAARSLANDTSVASTPKMLSLRKMLLAIGSANTTYTLNNDGRSVGEVTTDDTGNLSVVLTPKSTPGVSNDDYSKKNDSDIETKVAPEVDIENTVDIQSGSSMASDSLDELFSLIKDDELGSSVESVSLLAVQSSDSQSQFADFGLSYSDDVLDASVNDDFDDGLLSDDSIGNLDNGVNDSTGIFDGDNDTDDFGNIGNDDLSSNAFDDGVLGTSVNDDFSDGLLSDDSIGDLDNGVDDSTGIFDGDNDADDFGNIGNDDLGSNAFDDGVLGTSVNDDFGNGLLSDDSIGDLDNGVDDSNGVFDGNNDADDVGNIGNDDLSSNAFDDGVLGTSVNDDFGDGLLRNDSIHDLDNGVDDSTGVFDGDNDGDDFGDFTIPSGSTLATASYGTWSASLSGSGIGYAEFEREGYETEFDVQVRGARPNAALDVVIGSVTVGRIQTNNSGSGRLKFDNEHGRSLPDGFPVIVPGVTVAIGNSLSGVFGQSLGHDSDDLDDHGNGNHDNDHDD